MSEIYSSCDDLALIKQISKVTNDRIGEDTLNDFNVAY